jgi:hypothetical protein
MGRLADGPAFASAETQTPAIRTNETRDCFESVAYFVCIVVPSFRVFFGGIGILIARLRPQIKKKPARGAVVGFGTKPQDTKDFGLTAGTDDI